jgi:RND superfamily putative drug exporter
LRRRAIVVLLWVAIVAIFAPLGNRIEAELARTAVGASADSTTVSELLKKDFRSPFAQSALLVVRGIPDPRTTGGESMLRRIDSAVAAVPGVIATVSYLDSIDPYLIGDDQNSAVLIAGLDTEEDADAIVLQLQETSATFLLEAQTEAPGLSMRWTSEALLNREFREISGQEASRGELIALPLTLAVLIIVFGGIATALFPLTAGAVAIPVALGAAAVFATALPLTSIIVNVVTMIGPLAAMSLPADAITVEVGGAPRIKQRTIKLKGGARLASVRLRDESAPDRSVRVRPLHSSPPRNATLHTSETT